MQRAVEANGEQASASVVLLLLSEAISPRQKWADYTLDCMDKLGWMVIFRPYLRSFRQLANGQFPPNKFTQINQLYVLLASSLRFNEDLACDYVEGCVRKSSRFQLSALQMPSPVLYELLGRGNRGEHYRINVLFRWLAIPASSLALHDLSREIGKSIVYCNRDMNSAPITAIIYRPHTNAS